MGGSVNLSRDPVPTSGPPFDSSWNCTAGNPGTTHEEIKREAGEASFVKIVLVTAEDARNQPLGDGVRHEHVETGDHRLTASQKMTGCSRCPTRAKGAPSVSELPNCRGVHGSHHEEQGS
jgi:hypothetical protein